MIFQIQTAKQHEKSVGSWFDFCPRNSRLAMHNLSRIEKITIIQIDLDVSAVKRIETA